MLFRSTRGAGSRAAPAGRGRVDSRPPLPAASKGSAAQRHAPASLTDPARGDVRASDAQPRTPTPGHPPGTSTSRRPFVMRARVGRAGGRPTRGRPPLPSARVAPQPLPRQARIADSASLVGACRRLRDTGRAVPTKSRRRSSLRDGRRAGRRAGQMAGRREGRPFLGADLPSFSRRSASACVRAWRGPAPGRLRARR